MVNPTTYLKEVVRELKKVSWPDREETQQMTLLVIVVSIIVGLYLGVLDFIFKELLTYIIS